MLEANSSWCQCQCCDLPRRNPKARIGMQTERPVCVCLCILVADTTVINHPNGSKWSFLCRGKIMSPHPHLAPIASCWAVYPHEERHPSTRHWEVGSRSLRQNDLPAARDRLGKKLVCIGMKTSLAHFPTHIRSKSISLPWRSVHTSTHPPESWQVEGVLNDPTLRAMNIHLPTTS